jgi:hypothetical protein
MVTINLLNKLTIHKIMIAQIYFHLQICKSLYLLLHYHHNYNYILLLLFIIYLLIIMNHYHKQHQSSGNLSINNSSNYSIIPKVITKNIP